MMVRAPSGASVTRVPIASSASETIKAMIRPEHRTRKSVILLLSGIVALGLCAFQFGDRNELNGMPFTEVQPLVFDLTKAGRLAKQGNVELFAGQTEPGRSVSLRGEVTDANCYLGSHVHSYDHAFCAKLCVAAGGNYPLTVGTRFARMSLTVGKPMNRKPKMRKF